LRAFGFAGRTHAGGIGTDNDEFHGSLLAYRSES
jgi:hypothetical protein